MHIVPEPVSIELKEGKKFIFGSKTKFVCEDFDASIFDDFKTFTQQNNLEHEQLDPNEIKIFRIDDYRYEDEEYKLNITEDKIVIGSRTPQGAFYALQTLKQIVVQSNCKLPNYVVKDKPKFKYRAFMLDVGRYYFSVEEIKRYIDLMAAHKLNYFHWHLTEDQGWRIEIKKYPALTTLSSKRSHTNFNVFKPHAGFYTQEEVRDIVKYCHDRFIKVIPEFDIPGHSVAALAAYPHLGCFDRNLKVATHWGVKHDILCVGKDTTYEFVKDVIDEMIELFPDEYFHIGGDEVPKMRWKACPHCQEKIKQLRLNNEDELQQVFMSDINKYLRSKGKKTIIWNWDGFDNIDYLDKNITWQYCDKLDNPKIAEQINQGMNIIISSCFANYLDLPFAWHNIEMSYNNPSSSDKIDPKYNKNILGIEAPLWTEYVSNSKKADYMTFPRLGAIAENAWTSESKMNFKRFMKNLNLYYNFLDMYKVKYAKPKRIQPKGVAKFCGSLWFNRRVLHWQGLHNLIDDAIVKAKYGKDIDKFDAN